MITGIFFSGWKESSSAMKTKKTGHASKTSTKKWSKHVTETSNALDLEGNIFKSRSAKKIAASLKHSAENSNRKKTTPFQSAMSMLNFYENRAGSNLSASGKKILENAKEELRKLFNKNVDNR